ncbi:BBSome complex member BBS7-like isoform X2 [Choristoneura fumiferana]|uniref:BBSome complex member BBS7-like isoform X2 n=1 Tax=Choristoneura fumiferana TaxID=7141 RepID=UPI003D1583DB
MRTVFIACSPHRCLKYGIAVTCRKRQDFTEQVLSFTARPCDSAPFAYFSSAAFVIGDKNGVLQCLSIKGEEAVVQFKTLPGKPITAVQLATNDGSQADKVFAASGNEVKGYTRKGKVFLSIETSLSETITSIGYCKNHCRSILAGDLILCSGRTVTHYRDLREYHSYTCEDRVLDIAAFATPNNTRVRLLVLVANKGAVMLENGQIAARAVVTSGPSRLLVPPSIHAAEIYAFYGAADGSIGLIVCEKSMLTNKCLVEGKGLGSVMCLGWYLSNGSAHLAVGRHDGSVQLYFVDMENFAEKPRLKYTYFSGEPVTSVCGGCVGVEDTELLVTTFSGRVFALRSTRIVSGSGMLTNASQDVIATRRSKLEIEVARLEKQAANEREKYQRNTRSLQGGVSVPPLLDIQYELLGASQDGWQEARIMAPVPLDMLFIYCNRKLDMRTDSAAVLSICESQGSESDFLATVRCQAGTRRLWLRMRYAIGTPVLTECIRVLIYALPAGAPRVARLMKLRLPALPYYSQHEDPESDSESRTWCDLRVSGSFSVAEMTSWLSEALPGELPRPASYVAIARSHTLLRTILVCRLQRGLAIFKSDNISTISTIKEVISNCSVQKSIRLEMFCDIPDKACAQSFNKLEGLFRTEYQKHKDIALKKAIDALDLDVNTVDVNPVLCNDYLRVWKSLIEDDVEVYFDILVDTVMQWYSDWKVLMLCRTDQGRAQTELRPALLECNLDLVKKILSNDPISPQDPFIE